MVPLLDKRQRHSNIHPTRKYDHFNTSITCINSTKYKSINIHDKYPIGENLYSHYSHLQVIQVYAWLTEWDLRDTNQLFSFSMCFDQSLKFRIDQVGHCCPLRSTVNIHSVHIFTDYWKKHSPQEKAIDKRHRRLFLKPDVSLWIKRDTLKKQHTRWSL